MGKIEADRVGMSVQDKGTACSISLAISVFKIKTIHDETIR